MKEIKAVPRSANVIRWIARIWSTVVFAIAVLQITYPDSYATEPVPVVDWFLLSLWGIAVLGLAAAWRWEAIGALVAIATMFLREVAFFLLKGFWIPAFLLVWILIIPPAVLFLVAWMLTKRAEGKVPPRAQTS
jgi:hypothetical protein